MIVYFKLLVLELCYFFCQEETQFPAHAAFVAARSPWLRKQLLRAREKLKVRQLACCLVLVFAVFLFSYRSQVILK